MRSGRHARVTDTGCTGIRARVRVQAGGPRRWRHVPLAAVPVISDPSPRTDSDSDLGPLQVLGVVSVVEKIGCITDRILVKYGIGSGTPVFDLPEAA